MVLNRVSVAAAGSFSGEGATLASALSCLAEGEEGEGAGAAEEGSKSSSSVAGEGGRGWY